MTPELAFVLTLGLRMAITAAFVVTASLMARRVSRLDLVSALKLRE